MYAVGNHTHPGADAQPCPAAPPSPHVFAQFNSVVVPGSPVIRLDRQALRCLIDERDWSGCDFYLLHQAVFALGTLIFREDTND